MKMVEIRYGEQYEISDLAGQTVYEARERFQSEFGIPEKARARLNGSKVKDSAELDTVLNDDDKLTFAVAKGKGAYLVAALLMALLTTGGVFAYGFINASTTLTGGFVQEANFADVSVSPESGNLTWTGFGHYKGVVGGTPSGIFTVSTNGSGYTGDLVITVSLGNADELSRIYRVFSLQLEVVDPNNGNAVIDINEGPSADWVMLTLKNGSADMFINGGDSVSGNFSVRVKKGFYITQVHPGAWPSDGSADPDLFCEIAQR
jgi:molybdopterin converting factor small subunit